MKESCGDHCRLPVPSTPDSTASEIQTDAASSVSVFKVPKMDCLSEERMIRLALDGLDSIKALNFDLGSRRVRVVHTRPADSIAARLQPLGLGAALESTEAADENEAGATPQSLAEAEAKDASTLR